METKSGKKCNNKKKKRPLKKFQIFSINFEWGIVCARSAIDCRCVPSRSVLSSGTRLYEIRFNVCHTCTMPYIFFFFLYFFFFFRFASTSFVCCFHFLPNFKLNLTEILQFFSLFYFQTLKPSISRGMAIVELNNLFMQILIKGKYLNMSGGRHRSRVNSWMEYKLYLDDIVIIIIIIVTMQAAAWSMIMILWYRNELSDAMLVRTGTRRRKWRQCSDPISELKDFAEYYDSTDASVKFDTRSTQA